MKNYTVCVAWTPRDPSLDREKHTDIEVVADTPADAALAAFKMAYMREIRWEGCDISREEFEKQFEEEDICWDSSWFAEVPVAYRGAYTFLVT